MRMNLLETLDEEVYYDGVCTFLKYDGNWRLNPDLSCETLPNGFVEGVLGYIANTPINGSTLLYRSFYSATDNHLFTTSTIENSSALGIGYVQESSPGYVWTTP